MYQYAYLTVTCDDHLRVEGIDYFFVVYLYGVSLHIIIFTRINAMQGRNSTNWNIVYALKLRLLRIIYQSICV